MKKLLGKSRQGNMIKVEDSSNPKGYVWYFLDPKVINFVKTIKDDSMVELKIEEKNGEDTVVFISTNGSGNNTSGNNKVAPTASTNSFEKKTYGKSPEEQESIKKQAIMKSCCDAVSRAMAGQVDIDTLGSQIESLYDRLLNKIG